MSFSYLDNAPNAVRPASHVHTEELATQKRILKLMVLVIVPTAWLILSKTPKQSHDLIEVEMGD